jgi:LPXTG-motif cell wall-anchored protein
VDACSPVIDTVSFTVGVISVDKFAQDVFSSMTSGKTGTVNVIGALLAGAQFRIYGSLADAQAQRNPIAIRESTATGHEYLDGSTEAQGSADPLKYGHALIPGYVTCNYEEHADAKSGVYITGELAYGTYWVVETVAPPGYERVTTPVEVQVSAATSWGINGPASPACTGADGVLGTADDGKFDTVIPVQPAYNVATGAWVTTNDWPVARFMDAKATPVSRAVTAVTGALPRTGAAIGTTLLAAGAFILVGIALRTRRRRHIERTSA